MLRAPMAAVEMAVSKMNQKLVDRSYRRPTVTAPMWQLVGQQRSEVGPQACSAIYLTEVYRVVRADQQQGAQTVGQPCQHQLVA
jgi:hypothetical protein